jgi:hypothetical protein
LAGISQPTVRPVRRRDALRTEDMDAILASLDPADRLADARDAALLLIGWNAGLRTDDLARLDITDLVVVPEHGLAVHLRRSKTDLTGTGATLGITAADQPGDPLDAVAAWTRWRNRLASHGLHTGPAWRGIDRYGRRPAPLGSPPKPSTPSLAAAPPAPGWRMTTGDIASGGGLRPARSLPARTKTGCRNTPAGARRPP